MLTLFDDIRHAAPLESPVSVEGETGTGKELVARALHLLSRRQGKLVAVNASELAEPLAEAELFGSMRGAFTGAVHHRTGLIKAADRGTLFLDEAGDLPHALQLKLLRVLESGRVRHVGAEEDSAVRFRLVLSSQRPITDLLASGRWRPDFYYRVAGICLRTPCLAERRSDIPVLANHLLTEMGSAPLAVTDLSGLLSHTWPGNVRELRRVIERALHRARGATLMVKDLECAIALVSRPHAVMERRADGRTLRDAERRHIEAILQELDWDSRATAAVLGISRSTLYRRMQELGIPPRGGAKSQR